MYMADFFLPSVLMQLVTIDRWAYRQYNQFLRKIFGVNKARLFPASCYSFHIKTLKWTQKTDSNQKKIAQRQHPFFIKKLNPKRDSTYYTVNQKNKTQTLGHNFTNYYPIFEIFPLADSVANLQQIYV